MTSAIGIAAGMGLLLVSLATRNDDAPAFVPWMTGWLGSILVVAGTGKIGGSEDTEIAVPTSLRAA